MSGTFLNVGSLQRYGQRNGSLTRRLFPVNWLERATLRLRFNRGEVDPRILCGRTNPGTYFDSAGVLQTAAAGVPRLTYDPANLSADPGLLAEEARTNSIRNSTMQGAVAGTPGTLPTNWSAFPTAGLARSVVGVGTENGIPYVDVRFSGTTTASGLSVLYFEANNAVAASSAQVWTASSFVKMVGGSLTGLSFVIGVDELNSSGGFLAGSVSTTTPSSVLARFSHTRTLTNTSTAFLRPFIYSNVASGATIDITLRIGLPELSLGTISPISPPIPTSGTAVTRSADNLSMTDMSWYSSVGGVLYVDFQKNSAPGAADMVAVINDGTLNNRQALFVAANTKMAARISSSGVSANPPDTVNGISVNSKSKAALLVSVGRVALVLNGGGVVTSAPLSIGTVNQLQIGHQLNSQYLNGIIREIAFIPNPNISDGALQRLTR